MAVLITGARPGEKLHEQLAYAAEQASPTNHPGINAWKGELGNQFNLAAMIADLASVRTAPTVTPSSTPSAAMSEMTRPDLSASGTLESKQIPDDTLAAS